MFSKVKDTVNMLGDFFTGPIAPGGRTAGNQPCNDTPNGIHPKGKKRVDEEQYNYLNATAEDILGGLTRPHHSQRFARPMYNPKIHVILLLASRGKTLKQLLAVEKETGLVSQSPMIRRETAHQKGAKIQLGRWRCVMFFV